MLSLLSSTRDIISTLPSLYIPLARWRYRGVRERPWVSRDTEILIIGFARSGNTFSKLAFEAAQSKAVNLVTHLSAAAVVIEACRLRVPTVVLVRKPEDAVLSVVIQGEPWTMKQQLRRYVAFYSALVPFHRDYVTAPFTQVVGDFGKVTRRVNQRFGTNFVEFDHTPDNVDRCFDIMNQYHLEKHGSKALVEMRVNRPSEERQQIKDQLRAEFQATELRRLRTKADKLFQQFLSFAEQDS